MGITGDFLNVEWVPPERSHRILIISRCPPWPLHLGDRLILYHLARALSARRHRLHLLAFYQRPTDLADLTYYDRFFEDVQLVREPERGSLGRRLVKGSRFPQKAEQSWSPEMWSCIATKMRDQTFSLVHFFGGVAVYEYHHLARYNPTVITPYESYSLLLETEAEEGGGQSRAGRAGAQLRLGVARNFESWMFTPFDRTVMVSKKDAQVIKQLDSACKLAVIPNGVQIEKFVPSAKPGSKPVVLFTGNFAYGPNLDAAMILIKQVFPRIRKRIPSAHLMLVGADPPPTLQKYNRAPYITVTGRVPDMRVYLDQAAVYISPLRRGAGIKNKILEALAMEKAIIATPLSCDGIAVKHKESVLFARKPAEMATWAVRLLQRPKLRLKLGKAGRRVIEERYTWEQVADHYEVLYAQVIREYRERSNP